MAKTKIADKKIKKTAGELPIADMTREELIKKAGQLRAAIVKLRLEMKVGRSRNFRGIFVKRKELAQVLTMLRAKELSSEAKLR